MSEKIKILIADDHKLIRDAWSMVLNADERFMVIAECGDSLVAVDLAKEKKPDIILMDINIPPISGIEATARIRKSSPTSRVIGVSMHSQPAIAQKILKAGANGYVTKQSSKEELFEAIVVVNAGGQYICEEIKNNLSELLFSEEKGPNVNSLTHRELEIMELVRQGLSSKEIASQLDISLKTAEVHRHNILKKLKIKNSAALVNLMNTSGL
jgi:DNA-binding NarL/FixJ family response regulator